MGNLSLPLSLSLCLLSNFFFKKLQADRSKTILEAEQAMDKRAGNLGSFQVGKLDSKAEDLSLRR